MKKRAVSQITCHTSHVCKQHTYEQDNILGHDLLEYPQSKQEADTESYFCEVVKKVTNGDNQRHQTSLENRADYLTTNIIHDLGVSWVFKMLYWW